MTRWEQVEHRLRRRLAANVRTLRESRELTLEEVAHRGSINPRHWQKIESGEHAVTLKTLAKLCVALGVEVGDLLL